MAKQNRTNCNMDPYFSRSFLLSILNTLETKILDKPYHAECKVIFNMIEYSDIERMKTKLAEIPVDDKDINDLINLLDDFENNEVNVSRLASKIRQRIRDIVFIKVLQPKSL